MFAVETDGDAVGNAAATTGALVGGGLRDGLDGQPLDLGARGIPRDAGGAGIDDIADAGHGKRGFGDIGGQDDAAAAVLAKYAVLLLVRQAAKEGSDLDVFPLLAFDGLHSIADISLAREEAQDIAVAFAHELFDGLGQAVERVLVHDFSAGLELERPVADFYGVGTTGDFDDGGGVTVGIGKVGGKAFWVDGCGGDDHLEVGTLGQ